MSPVPRAGHSRDGVVPVPAEAVRRVGRQPTVAVSGGMADDLTGAASATAADAGDVAGADPTVGRADEVAGRLMVALARISRRLRHGNPAELGPGLLSALSTIVVSGPVRVGDLATIEGVRAPSMTRIVDALVGAGTAERVPDPADGRACLVRATTAGTDMIAGLTLAKSRQLTARVARLDDEQRAILRAALPVLEALSADEGPESPPGDAR